MNYKIDRPLGSRHPKHGFMYMLNYGYIPNTISGDGEELDMYLLGEYEPVEEGTGKVIAIIHRTNDDDDKLIVSKEGKDYSDDAIRALTKFQERFFESVIVRKRNYKNMQEFAYFFNYDIIYMYFKSVIWSSKYL